MKNVGDRLFCSKVIICWTILAFITSSSASPSAYYTVTQYLRSTEAVVGKVPPRGGTQPIDVYLSLVPNDITKVDDSKQVVNLRTHLYITWNDPCLSWQNHSDPSARSLAAVNLSPDEIWKPTIFITNGVSDNLQLDLPGYMTVYANGTVSYLLSFLVNFRCSMDLWKYPFDVQSCDLLVAAKACTEMHSHVFDHPVYSRQSLHSQFQTSNEWEILRFSGIDRVTAGTGTNISVFHFVLKRRTEYYVMCFIVPVVVTSYMNTLVFIVPGNSGERVSFVVSIFVSNAVFIGFYTNQMPAGMDTIPLVMYLLHGIMVESGILIIVASLLTRFEINSLDVVVPGVKQNAVHPDPAADQAFIKGDERAQADDQQKAHCRLQEGRRNTSSLKLDLVYFVVAVVLNTAFVLTMLLSII